MVVHVQSARWSEQNERSSNLNRSGGIMGELMKEYNNEDLGLSFGLPVDMTVRERLQYRERLFLTIDTADMYSRYWDAVQPLLADWTCEIMPDPAAVDLDVETDPRMVEIVVFVANTVAGHMHDVEEVPKNS